MLDDVKEKISNLENIAYNFKTMTNSRMTFTKEKMADLNEHDPKLPLKFDYLITAISNNGGLIAICKQHTYFDQEKTNIQDNILVMHQDADTRYYIPLTKDYHKTYIVSLDFNENEQLYGFCNDGTLLKIDILTRKAVTKINSQKILEEGIIKAKTFENGFIVLTGKGNIYYVKDIRNPEPILMINIQTQLHFSNNIDFIGIPSSKSKSRKFELLIINEKGNGVLHIEQNDNPGKEVPVSILTSRGLVKYSSSYSDFENVGGDNNSDLGKINAMVLSPSKNQIALYCSNNRVVYCLPSDLREISSMRRLKFEIDDELSNEEINEVKAILAYNPKYQLLFCSEDAVALCGQRFILIVNSSNENTYFQTVEGRKMDALSGVTLMKCIQEVDGIRYLTKDGVFLISKVSNELNDICQPFSENSAKKLINAYGKYLSKSADCDREIREIAGDLPEAIKFLQIAAANIYWTNNLNEINKELQMILIKAAQYGKSFVQKGDFNYDTYIENCNAIRIINCLRNEERRPRFLTFEEYLSMDPDVPTSLIKKVLRHLNYNLAFQISNFLGCDTEKIFQRYIMSNIKLVSNEEDEELSDKIKEKIKQCPNLSYITLAKKCIKNNKHKLAEKFLQGEKSIVVKVPQYLNLKKWTQALELSLQSHDRTVIKIVIDKIFKVEEFDRFVEIVAQHPKAHSACIEYLKNHDRGTDLVQYLGRIKDYEELIFMKIENFFKGKKLGDRIESLKQAKEHLNDLKGSPNYNFYKLYLEDIENSLRFKKECIDPKNSFILSNDINSFDNSIYDCYKLGVGKNFSWIEKQNKNYFSLGKKKLTYLKFKNYASEKKLGEIEKETKANNAYKNLEITPLEVAKILYEYKHYDEAMKYIRQITDPKDFDEKIALMKNMQKYEDALEIAISDKKNDRVIYAVNDIIRDRPDLKNRVNDLCKKYNVNLG